MGLEGIFGFGKKKETQTSEEDRVNKEAISKRLEDIEAHHDDPYQPEAMPQPEKKEDEDQQSFHHHADQERFDRLNEKFSDLEMSPQEIRDLENEDSEYRDYRDMKRLGMSPSKGRAA